MLLARRNSDWMPGIFDEFFGNTWDNFLTPANRTQTSVPAVNVKEDNDKFHVEVAAPGMNKDDFKVHLENNVLTISSEKEIRDEDKDEQGNYTRREFSYTSFKRSFTLPENQIDVDNIKANYKDGVLSLALPKKEEAKVKPVKEISIS
ncbi:MAG: Hsp20 family protein [Bacteroidetes bacterium]|jgi:HSP20 family protein|nr:Hsp20 family protein [Bacteroidota bacterium]